MLYCSQSSLKICTRDPARFFASTAILSQSDNLTVPFWQMLPFSLVKYLILKILALLPQCSKYLTS